MTRKPLPFSVFKKAKRPCRVVAFKIRKPARTLPHQYRADNRIGGGDRLRVVPEGDTATEG